MHPSEEPTLDWNLQELLERVDGDREFMCELLMIFREDSLATVKKAKVAVENGELGELSRVAHTLKGMLRNLARVQAGISRQNLRPNRVGD